MDEVVKASSLNIKDIHIDAFVLNPDNVNEMSEDDLKKLCDHISEVGFLDPVQVIPIHDGRFKLLDGEHRYKAGKILGMTYLPSVVLTDEKWADNDLSDLVSFRLNNIKGSQNPEKFIKLYDRLAKKFGAESLKEVFAMTDKALWKKLTKSLKTDMKKAGMPDEVVNQIDQADKKAKDFTQFSKYVNKIFTDQSKGSLNGCVLFSSGTSEHIMIQASQNVFDAIKALSSLASSQSKNINDYLEGPLLDLLTRK